MMDIWILDDKYEALAVWDTFDSIVWTTRFNDVCEAEIVVAPFDNVLNYLKIGRYLSQKNSDRFMLIDEFEIVEDVVNGDTVTIRIEDLSSILKRRVINKYTTLQCSFQDAIYQLLNDHIMNPSDSSRRIPGFHFRRASGSVFNTSVDKTFIGENLFDAISSMCKELDVGFRVLPTGAGEFTFELYAGYDRSYDQTALPAVIFSYDFENLLNSRYTESVKDKKTNMYIAGEGEGPDQFITEISAPNTTTSGLERREAFTEVSVTRRTDREDAEGNPIDLTDAEYAQALAEKGAIELAEYVAIKAFDGEIDAERQFVLNRDFFIGDVVQVVNKWKYESVCRIIEIVETEDASEGHLFYPTFSSLEHTL